MDERVRTPDEPELQLVIFQLGKEDYAIDVSQVREIIAMVGFTRMPNAPGYLKGIINLRGQILAVIDLAERLGIEAIPEEARIIVVEAGDARAGLIVDSVSEVARVPVGDLEPSPVGQGDSGLIRGVIKHGSKLLILLDPALILAGSEVEAIGSWEAPSL
jgi:purine-binding chemotaxis protein CheW